MAERSLTRDDVLTADEVAAMLHCSRRHVYNLARRRELPGARQIGRSLVVVRPVLETWLRTGRRSDG
ncbi:helix-turn-helix domain-containing protein [Patulibacter minatonensis]|uniref:helix-turn-helix domain-containing protein n=1 Tax=Patulibacter minatonensis TaxID=298163 RepID=UPI000A01A4E7